jgi:hypothetical protein
MGDPPGIIYTDGYGSEEICNTSGVTSRLAPRLKPSGIITTSSTVFRFKTREKQFLQTKRKYNLRAYSGDGKIQLLFWKTNIVK